MKKLLFLFVALAAVNNAYAGWDDRYGDDKSIHDDQPRCAEINISLK